MESDQAREKRDWKSAGVRHVLRRAHEVHDQRQVIPAPLSQDRAAVLTEYSLASAASSQDQRALQEDEACAGSGVCDSQAEAF